MTLENFETLLKKYADLMIHKGIAVKEGDYVLLNANINQAPLARLITEAAYQAGAAYVKVNWSDDALGRLNYTYRSLEILQEVPQYLIDEGHYFVEKRAKRISLVSHDPNALKGIDPNKINASNRAFSNALEEVRNATQSNKVSWLVVAGASQEWAALVFPDKSPEDQIDALWDQIFKTTRIYEADPIKAWEEHENRLNEKATFLNDHQFDALHYTGPGTDLTLGLPKNHIWESAGSTNEKGEVFIANMPTEEVFTAPDSRRADGYISASKPLAHGGVVIDGMKFTFKDGKVVEASASEGEETLIKLIEENEGSASLGEVALVPHQSPISQSGIIFFNTLFDENASNHIALGQAYASSVQGGTQMTQEELAQAGLNRSNVHVDFMVGNAEMNVDGITEDGQRIPIFRNGEWAI